MIRLRLWILLGHGELGQGPFFKEKMEYLKGASKLMKE